MAATVTASSPWGKKAGAWAQDAEEHEEELQRLKEDDSQNDTSFPSLAAAAATKQPKKNKKMSLAEFNLAPASTKGGLTRDEILSLPTGPRQRSAEELDGSRLGGGFRSYGRGGDDSSRGSRFSNREGGRDREREREREYAPSRADEVDDWSKTKKSVVGSNGFERRERSGGSFFEESRSVSKADESDNWVASKAVVEPRRFESRGSFDSLSRGRDVSTNGGGGADSDNWGRRKDESNGNGTATGGRPRLLLQPRTLPVSDDATVAKPKASSPFGEARPREEVLAKKGKDWKEIDEKLEAVKVTGSKEAEKGERRESYGWRKDRSRFGNEGAAPLERNWRKPEPSDPEVPTESAASSENGHAPENGNSIEDCVAEAN